MMIFCFSKKNCNVFENGKGDEKRDGVATTVY